MTGPNGLVMVNQTSFPFNIVNDLVMINQTSFAFNIVDVLEVIKQTSFAFTIALLLSQSIPFLAPSIINFIWCNIKREIWLVCDLINTMIALEAMSKENNKTNNNNIALATFPLALVVSFKCPVFARTKKNLQIVHLFLQGSNNFELNTFNVKKKK